MKDQKHLDCYNNKMFPIFNILTVAALCLNFDSFI